MYLRINGTWKIQNLSITHMTLDKFYKQVKDILQIERKEKNFPSHLKTLLGAYLESYRDLDDSYFKDGTDGKVALMEDIQEVCKGVEDCLNLYSRANIGDCIKKMHQIISHDFFCAYRVEEGSLWYRSRMVEDRKKVLKAKEMFHVPFELVRKIGNNRFSISGYPCLYLSNTIWACWEEMKEPAMEDFCTSLVKPTKDIELLDLRFPNTNYKQIVEKVLYSLPLIIACSVEVECPDDPFKPEYILPQIVMLALVNHEKYQGCSFTSTKKINNFDWPDDLLCNIAMPVKCVKDAGLCPKLIDSFMISDSVNYKYEVLKCNIAPVRSAGDAGIEEIFGGSHVKSTVYEDYEESIFGQMEKILKEKYEPYRIESKEPKNEPVGLDIISV